MPSFSLNKYNYSSTYLLGTKIMNISINSNTDNLIDNMILTFRNNKWSWENKLQELSFDLLPINNNINFGSLTNKFNNTYTKKLTLKKLLFWQTEIKNVTKLLEMQ